MLLWGLLFPVVKLGYTAFEIVLVGEILTFAGVRFTVCGLIILAFSLIRDKKCLISLKNNWHKVLLSGVFAIILHYGFTYLGLSMTDGSKTAILKQLGAVFYICFSALIFPNDKLTLGKIIGLILGVGGILAINLKSGSISFQIGDILIIAASFCTVFSNVISKKVFEFVNPVVSTGVSQLFGGVVLLAIGSILGGNVINCVPKTTNQIVVFIIMIFASVMSYCLWFIVVSKENLSKLFIIKFAEPLFATVFSFFLLGEDIINLNYIFAFVLISSGIVVANLKFSISKKDS